MEEQKTKIKNYITLLNDDTISQDLLNFFIDSTIDRILVYCNRQDLPVQLERVVAQMIDKVINHHVDKATNGDTFVSSISDNGQSINYSNEIKQYYNSLSDSDLMEGYITLLNRFRRANVVSKC